MKLPNYNEKRREFFTMLEETFNMTPVQSDMVFEKFKEVIIALNEDKDNHAKRVREILERNI